MPPEPSSSRPAAYFLTRGVTRSGNYRVVRGEWDFDFSPPARHADHPVSPVLETPEATVEWARDYAAANPGCLTYEQACKRQREIEVAHAG